MGSAGFWSFLGSALRVFLGLFSIIILSKIYDPSSFGVFAQLNILFTALFIVGDFGYSILAISNGHKDANVWYDSKKFHNSVALILALLSIPASLLLSYLSLFDFYMAFAVFLSALLYILCIDEMAYLRFLNNQKKLQLIQFTGYVFFLFAAVSIGTLNEQINGLTIGLLLQYLVIFILANRQGISFKRGETNSYFDKKNFLSNSTASNIMNWLVANLDTIMLSFWASTEILGKYNRLSTLLISSFGIVVSAIQSLFLPLISSNHAETDKIKKIYVNSMIVMSSAASTFIFLFLEFGPYLIPKLLGQDWNISEHTYIYSGFILLFSWLSVFSGPIYSVMLTPHYESRSIIASLAIGALVFGIMSYKNVNNSLLLVLIVKVAFFIVVNYPMIKSLGRKYISHAIFFSSPLVLLSMISLNRITDYFDHSIEYFLGAVIIIFFITKSWEIHKSGLTKLTFKGESQ